MDVIGPIEPTASNRHRFIFVAIDYFTKWVEVDSYKSVNKKVVALLETIRCAGSEYKSRSLLIMVQILTVT